ncbi:MAG: hypothetical protein GF353_22430, partial [Candidatus Lokiarchaeota archaeon]|nr:hypothetical protein [Candidatus Lokiarchaeota archaeon]
MKKILGKILRIIFYGLFVSLFLFVSSQLFFKKEAEKVINYIDELVFGAEEEELTKLKDLRVIYPEEPDTLEPTAADPVTRQRLVNIYESLVKPDRDLNMQPSLAISWGIIDDTTWEFRLRPNVVFHDGSKFDVEDVVESLNRASTLSKSELAGAMETVESIDVLDELRFRINTKEPDPLLLQKLSKVLIIPSEKAEEKEIYPPVGTASYKFSSWDSEEQKMVFEKFSDYWGEVSKFDSVEMYSRVDKSERVNMFLRGEGDLLAFVPYDVVSTIEERGFEIKTVPTLEVQFILFDVNSEILGDVKRRKAISLAIDQEALVEAVGGYARPVSQFVSNGVFGF